MAKATMTQVLRATARTIVLQCLSQGDGSSDSPDVDYDGLAKCAFTISKTLGYLWNKPERKIYLKVGEYLAEELTERDLIDGWDMMDSYLEVAPKGGRK